MSAKTDVIRTKTDALGTKPYRFRTFIVTLITIGNCPGTKSVRFSELTARMSINADGFYDLAGVFCTISDEICDIDDG
jgi:hypothetical protein